MRRRLWQGGAALVVLAAIAAVALWSRGSNQVKIINNSSAKPASSAPAAQTLRNQYFSFTYPGIYHMKSQTIQPPDLADYVLEADANYTKQLAVTLLQASVKNTSAYIYRQTRNDIYSSRQTTVNGNDATVWTKTDGNEQTAFLGRGGLTAIISFSVQNTNANSSLTGELNGVLSSFQWH